MRYTGIIDDYLTITYLHETDYQVISQSQPSDLTLIWFVGPHNRLIIDLIPYQFDAHQIICLTEFHKIEVQSVTNARMIRFNRPFYCILDHDSDVGCKGILFFGASALPVVNIPPEELRIFETVFDMFVLELQTKDNLQLEMLQMMLKRFLILCTRVYRNQEAYRQLADEQTDIIRNYNFLVEQHFRTKHSVAEYADMLHKSPKTLANVFARLGSKTPLQFIQDRKMLEARRLLRYTDKSIKEIAYEIGFEDIQTFGRFFKKIAEVSPSEYRKATSREKQPTYREN